MTYNTQLTITGTVIIGATAFITIILRNMRKQEKAWDAKEKEKQQENMRHLIPISKQKRQKKVEDHIVMNKILHFKRPGPRSGVRWWNCEDVVRKHLKKKRITCKKFAITSRQYTEYKGLEKRKKAQGYWEFEIIYG